MIRLFFILLGFCFLMAGCAQDAYIHKSGDTMNSERWDRDDRACKTKAENKKSNFSGSMRRMKKQENEYQKCMEKKGWQLKQN